jgi:hypothetical protein
MARRKVDGALEIRTGSSPPSKWAVLREVHDAMEQVLIGLCLVLIGILVCFCGLRFWFILLPLIGGAIGFYIGARFIQEIFGTGFLSTGVSWVGGIVLGFGFAFMAWFVWYAGVVILAGAFGAILASGLLHALFDQPWGWALLVVTVIGAVVFGVLAIVLHLPSSVVVVASAFVGAAMAVAGVMTMLGTVTIGELADGVAIAVVDEVKYQGSSWLWVLGGLALALVGALFQLQSIAQARLPEARWVRAQTV